MILVIMAALDSGHGPRNSRILVEAPITYQLDLHLIRRSIICHPPQI